MNCLGLSCPVLWTEGTRGPVDQRTAAGPDQRVSGERTSVEPAHLDTVPEDSRAEDSDVDDLETTPSLTEDSDSPRPRAAPGTSAGPSGVLRKDESDQEEDDQSETGELKDSEDRSKGPAVPPGDKPKVLRPERPPVRTAEVRTLQLTALQKTPFRETLSSDCPQDTDTGGTSSPWRPSRLETIQEGQNRTTEDTRHEDQSRTETAAAMKTTEETPEEDALCPPEMKTPEDTLCPPEMKTPEDTLCPPEMKTPEDSLCPLDMRTPGEDAAQAPLQTGSRFLVDLSRDDGTYRANPVLVCETETDESLAGSVTDIHSSGAQETCVLSEDLGPSGPGPGPPEDRCTSISELRLFWEKENSGPRVIRVKVQESRSGPAVPQSGLEMSSDSKQDLHGGTPASGTIMAEGRNPSEVSDPGPDPHNQTRSARTPTGTGERSWSPAKQLPRPANHDEDVRRSPSKTCHPKVLPRDPSTSPGSGLGGSPLKTFPIDIHPQQDTQRRSPSHGARTKLSSAGPPQSRTSRGDAQQNGSKPSASPGSVRASEEMYLARSFVPQDYQHYLGPEERAHGPPFPRDQVPAETEDPHRPERPSCPQGIPATIAASAVRKRSGGSDQEAWFRSRSLPWAATGSQSERSTSIMSALKWFSSRNPSSAKSLENLSSQAGGQQRNGQRDELNLSVDDVSSLPPSEQMRTSVSVPVFQQDETDSDGTLETGVRNRRNTSSSTSNISISSGMASMSSVSGSTGSLFPAEVPEAQVEVQGSVQFAVNYIQKLEEFQVFVVLCRGLAAADGKRSRSDPYVKCYLLPDKTRLGKRKTSVKKKTVNPTYHEILRFKVPMEVLKTQNLNLSVWHNDTFGRNSFLGEAELDLSQWDFSNTHINDYLLTARVSGRTSPSRLADGRGRMRVALRFLPQTSHSSGTPGTPGTARTSRTSRVEAGEVQIWVKDCKNLPSVRGIVIDPFVKCAVLPDTSRKSRQKTRVVKRTASPMFNHTMVYDGFRPEDLREACAEITVWDHDRINSRYVGGLRLGLGSGKSYGVEVTWMDSSPAEADLWRRMLQLPGEWVEDVLPLRTLVLAKNM